MQATSTSPPLSHSLSCQEWEEARCRENPTGRTYALQAPAARCGTSIARIGERVQFRLWLSLSGQLLSAATTNIPAPTSKAMAMPPMIERTGCRRLADFAPASALAFCAAATPIQNLSMTTIPQCQFISELMSVASKGLSVRCTPPRAGMERGRASTCPFDRPLRSQQPFAPSQPPKQEHTLVS
jgi:hypothetical protein